MWCSRRSFAALALAGLAAGCGFAPVYGPGGRAAALRGQIRPDDPVDRDGFDFVARLEDRIGRADAPAYALSYTVATEQTDVGVTPGQETTRYNVLGKVDYAVVDLGRGEIVHAGTADSFTGYSTTGSIVSTRTAAADARARLMTILADRVVTDLIATAPSWLR